MDAAFATAKYPAYTTRELLRWLADHAEGVTLLAADKYHDICAELTRRGKVAAGDRSVMTPVERLRASR